MAFVSLGRFTQRDEDGIGPCWCPPDGVTALIDLVPPGQDSDPDVNFALMLSDSPLNSNDVLYTFGTGNVTDLQLDGTGQNAWETITGFRPTQGTIANAIAQHLLNPNGANGLDFARPLTAGFNRGLEIQLGGEVWSHTLTGLSDLYSLPVLRVEAEGLAEIYRTQGETQYRLSMGALRRKYDMRPIKELIAYLFPSGRDDLPLMDELEPQTIKTETWPTTGAITSGQDNAWTTISGTLSVSPAGELLATTNWANTIVVLDYSFGGSDRKSACVMGWCNSGRSYLMPRSNSTGNSGYCVGNYANVYGAEIIKIVAGTQTNLRYNGSLDAGNALGGWSIGSTHTMKVGASTRTSATDTAVPTGTYSAIYMVKSNQGAVSLVGPMTFDDLMAATTNRIRRLITAGGA